MEATTKSGKFPAKKVFLIAGPIAAAALIIWLINRKKKPIIDQATDDDVKPATLTASSSTGTSSSFPLKQGSRGDKVKELQRIIGADPDGIFGPNTENALIQFAAIRVVNSQKELDELRNKATGISSKSRADDLVARFKKGGVSMYVIQATKATQVQPDVYGALIETGRALSLSGGKVYNNSDYVLSGSTKLGKLMFSITRGDLAGTYVIDPNVVSLK